MSAENVVRSYLDWLEDPEAERIRTNAPDIEANIRPDRITVQLRRMLTDLAAI